MRIRLDIPLSLSEIEAALGVPPVANRGEFIEYISTDTRELSSGDLFFAIRGEKFDGGDFLQEARALGAITVGACENAEICVSDTKDALLSLAAYYKSRLPLRHTVIITGSVGKTTTKEICKALISPNARIHATEGNLNNEFGVPFTILCAPRDTEILVLEAGMNHAGELARISRATEPDIAVITRIGSAHIGNFQSREAIARAKCEILLSPKLKSVVFPFGEPLLPSLPFSKTASTSSPEADFYLDFIFRGVDGGEFKYYSHGEILSAGIRSLGAHIPECLVFALAICEEISLSKTQIAKALADFSYELPRCKTSDVSGITIIDDSYNSSPEAVVCAIKTLVSFPAARHSLLLGDILELGYLSRELHERLGEGIEKEKIDALYLFGRYSDDIKRGAMRKGFPEDKIFTVCEDLNRLAEIITEQAVRGEALLVKGSHDTGLYRIIPIIKQLMKEKRYDG